MKDFSAGICCKLVLLMVVAAILIAPGSLFSPVVPMHAQAASDTTVTVDASKLSFPIAPNFIGFSMEVANICSLLSLDQQTPALAQLFMNFGSGTLRIGGTTLNMTTWVPDGTPSCAWGGTVVTKSLIDNIFAFAKKVNWKVIWAVNLRHYDPLQFIDEANYAVQSGGTSLLAVEFGNEPDMFGQGYTTFKAHWEAYYNAFRALEPTAPVSGPALAHAVWYPAFMTDEASKIALSTAHWYFGRAYQGNYPTIGTLLSAVIMKQMRTQLQIYYNSAHTYNVPLQIEETNSFFHQGKQGVSDVFAAALWAADYMFAAAENGVVGMNFHGIPNNTSGNSKGLLNYFSPVNSDGTPASDYYGMLLFHYAADNGTVVPVQISTTQNVVAHAVLGSDGHLRVTITNKSLKGIAHVIVNTAKAYTTARAISLTAPALNATTGITLGGNAIAPDGTWAPTIINNLVFRGNQLGVTLAAGSALVITYS